MTARRGHTQEDHTADMILHGRGALFSDALEEIGLCMFELMSPNCSETVDVVSQLHFKIEVVADSQTMLMFHFLNELLTSVWGEHKCLVGKIELKHAGKFLERVQQEEEEPKQGDAENVNEEGKPAGAASASPPVRTVTRWLLRAVAHGEVWDPSKHEPGTDVKAVTMHGLTAEEDERDMLFHASCVVDI
jgi:SHS2 domain-containing protein